MVYSVEKSLSHPVPTPAKKAGRASPEQVYGVNRRVRLSPRMKQMLENIIKTAQKTLNIAAASILLFGDKEEELFFEVTSGSAGNALRKVKLSTRYGIAGQVARTGKPLIVNDVGRSEKFHKMIDDTTGLETKSLICTPLMVQQRILGVMEVINKLDGSDFGEQDMDAVVSVAATTAMTIDNTRQYEIVTDAFKRTLSVLATAVDAKDPYSCGHSQRVMEYTIMAGTCFTLSPDETSILQYAAILHDIGKIEIDACILTKSYPLTPEEWDVIHHHPAAGARMLREIAFLKQASELVLHHHERWDGKGYPEGLKGEEIPLGSRLIAIADAFDTMTTGRSYCPAVTIDNALQELRDNAGTQFSPAEVAAFISGLRLRNGEGKPNWQEPCREEPELETEH